MSVAENPAVVERSPRNQQQALALGSLLGAIYVLASLWIIFAGLPVLWSSLLQNAQGEPIVNEFLSAALLMMIAVAVGVGLAYGGYLLLKESRVHGLRAGIFFAALMIVVSLWIGEALGGLFQSRQLGAGVGYALLAVIVGLLLAGTAFLFLQPAWAQLLQTVEDQGWFSSVPFKPHQGVRVRRGTVVAVLALGITGIITLIQHRTFGSDRLGDNDWFWLVPFSRVVTDDFQYQQYVPLMFKVHLIMPVILGGLLLWFAWRLVNVPTFADFLVATEAEMNKVSWTSRRRLIQDTIVVLVTVFLFTVFLFAVDVLWIKVLNHPWVGVLIVDLKAQQQKQQEKTQW